MMAVGGQEEHPRSGTDAMIAAIAAVHDLTLATRNIKHFESLGVSLVNPWAYEKS